MPPPAPPPGNFHPAPPPPGIVQIFFLEFDTFFDIQFKNTSNLIFLGFKVSFERFIHKNFKTGITFDVCGFRNIGGTLAVETRYTKNLYINYNQTFHGLLDRATRNEEKFYQINQATWHGDVVKLFF